jgi:uncharacterized protein (TIGR03000 family)
MYSIVLMVALSSGGELPGCHLTYGCYGGGCYGVSAACYGCYGGPGWVSRTGGYGSCYGCYGGCYGCHGGCWGAGCYGGGGRVAPVAPPPRSRPPEPIPKPAEKKASLSTAPAALVVNLPAEAQLTVDDYAATATSPRRFFDTPPLLRGRDYYYNLKADLVLNDKTITVTKRVLVRAGMETQVTLEFPQILAQK